MIGEKSIGEKYRGKLTNGGFGRVFDGLRDAP
jgi:hypothetical protein